MDIKSKEEIREEVEIETKRLVNSFKYAGTGILTAFKEERNMKIHFLTMLIVVILGFVFKINKLDWIFVILFLGTILSVELLNTAIEACVDLVTKEYNPLAKKAKDAGSAAAFSISVLAGIGLLMVYLPHILEFIK